MEIVWSETALNTFLATVDRSSIYFKHKKKGYKT